MWRFGLVMLVACGGSEPAAKKDTTEPLPPTGTTTTIPSTWGSFDPDFEAELDENLDEALALTGAPGVALAVLDPGGGRLWMDAAGDAELGVRGWEVGMPYPIGSVTKTFTSALILQLAEEGTLTLDDPMDDWVTTPWAGQGITIRHLLQHTSGIASYNYVGGWDGSDPVSPQDMIDWAAYHEPALYFAPGTGWDYSNTGFVILGLIGEEATGQPLDEAFQQRFFGPLGMTQTYLAHDHPTDLVHGYQGQPLVDTTDDFHPTAGWAAGGAVSTPEDVAIWGMALFTGQVVSQQTLTEMTTQLQIDGQDTGYGLGLFGAYDEEWGGNWGHTGGYSGQLTHLYYMERVDRVVVAMVNSFEADLDDVADAAWFPIWGYPYPFYE